VSRLLELTRAWAAITGLGLIGLTLLLGLTGQPISQVLPMLIAGILGYEFAFTGRDLWRRRKHG
jgi:hypothetical protein